MYLYVISTKFCSCVRNVLQITKTYFIYFADILVLFYTPRVTFKRCLVNQGGTKKLQYIC